MNHPDASLATGLLARIDARHSLGLDGFSPHELTPTAAIVTGGGRGIGRMFARALAGAGADRRRRRPLGRQSLAETVALIEADRRDRGPRRSPTSPTTAGPGRRRRRACAGSSVRSTSS